MLNDELRQLLLDHVDDRLGPDERARAEALLATDPSARRFVAEHHAVWSALGEAYGELTGAGRPGDGLDATAFRELALRRRRREALTFALFRWTPRLAAAALVVLAVSLGWRRYGPSSDDQVVRHLHLLQNIGFLQVYGEQLDLQGDVWIYKAFEGELEEEG